MNLKPLCLALAGLMVAGCESVSDAAGSVRAKFDSRTLAQTRTYAAPPRVTYVAARAACEQMGYRFLRGGPAQGELDAVSGIAPGEVNRSSRQVAVKVRLHATLDGTGTEVSARFSEILEADSRNRAGLATETPLRDTPQYEVFFRSVQQALDAQTGARQSRLP